MEKDKQISPQSVVDRTKLLLAGSVWASAVLRWLQTLSWQPTNIGENVIVNTGPNSSPLNAAQELGF